MKFLIIGWMRAIVVISLIQFLAVLVASCVGLPSSPEIILLTRVNEMVNRQGNPCPLDYCLDAWPDPSDLKRIVYWDCKAYAVAKADRLMREFGYAPSRLESILVSGRSLAVTHAALIVDGQWVLDQGVRCDVCKLEKFTHGVNIVGRLRVDDLKWVSEVLQRSKSD
jgi:hypothetical protein